LKRRFRPGAIEERAGTRPPKVYVRRTTP
jgi:hypothetical protein